MTTRPRFEELAWRSTPIGELSLRRRVEPSLGVDVYEVKLGDEFLMSSLFTAAEEELARLALAELDEPAIDVVVGGLGLGYTARTALADARVRSLTVVDLLEDVIDWQRRGLLPGATELTDDPRTELVAGNFFARAASASGFDATAPGRRFHAILLDIDHSPRHVLDSTNARFYTEPGLRELARHLLPGGVFALWSDDPPDESFRAVAQAVFATVRAVEVSFPNFYTGSTSANTIYLAR
ncbi:spermidine synthase [Georgenia satyanarayanai]|uniref:spermidine synthase n=1 Tax=Georgenia satyanarayanai TaxID=860221 RepID=UPI0012648E78|nr:spermidine synthase [Georgenia satyanarayanai]